MHVEHHYSNIFVVLICGVTFSGQDSQRNIKMGALRWHCRCQGFGTRCFYTSCHSFPLFLIQDQMGYEKKKLQAFNSIQWEILPWYCSNILDVPNKPNWNAIKFLNTITNIPLFQKPRS